ncbi:cyclic nucleotide-gated ion channel 1-like [Pyrus x bretschneideri]|uniref:cyclic nucleotide-gated ion channel 1-like n=1 Tax=Pyrus x bretschneideri TaxID=225117 RepID=UPI00202EEE5F|nr:cyclic nucleotide-gated ion channel 1-like [Pyrus x bretschneideri]
MERIVSIETSDGEDPVAKKMGRKAGESSKAIWNMIFAISCVFAVSLDPLFFYVMIIDQDDKCLQMDKTLSIVACLTRSLTDVIFLVHFILEIYDRVQNPKPQTQKNGGNSDKKSKIRKLIDHVSVKIAQKMPWLSVFTVIGFFALLPLPQLLIGIIFYTMKGSGFVEHKNVLTFFLLCQYFPRIYRIYLSAKDFKMINGKWIKGLYNMFLYILSSHVLGAFWYFFSIQRELTCWQEACVNHSKDPRACLNTFNCDSRSTIARNITFLNEHCPLDNPNGASSPFNFGIFIDSLQNQNTEHILFRKKFFYSLWWGLRNISNFGTNLTTSTYVWENLFAIFISIVGLLLFLYLIGNVQTFMQMEATKKEEIRQKIKMKKLDVHAWMSTNELPYDIREEILSSIKQTLKQKTLKQHIDADLHNFLFSILPRKTKTSLKRCLCMKTLKKVKILQGMHDKVLTLMCDYLQPVTYIENSNIFRMGDPLDCMLIIMEGTVWTYASSDSQLGRGNSSMGTMPLRKGDFYGEELFDWAPGSFAELPVSSKHVKTRVKVDAFLLTAHDLYSVVSKHRLQWKKGTQTPAVKFMAASTIATTFRRGRRLRAITKVKKLQDMDDKMLTSICDYTTQVSYNENSFIFQMGDPIDRMLFIIGGIAWTYTSSDVQAEQGIPSMAPKPLRKGDFYGEELLDCASDSFTKLPISSKHVRCQTKVEAFVLMAKDLKTVISKYPLQWEKNEKKRVLKR